MAVINLMQKRPFGLVQIPVDEKSAASLALSVRSNQLPSSRRTARSPSARRGGRTQAKGPRASGCADAT